MYSRWYNKTQNTGESHDAIAVPASCCAPGDVTASVHRRCQLTAARLQIDSAHDTSQNRRLTTTHGNHTFHLQVFLHDIFIHLYSHFFRTIRDTGGSAKFVMSVCDKFHVIFSGQFLLFWKKIMQEN